MVLTFAREGITRLGPRLGTPAKHKAVRGISGSDALRSHWSLSNLVPLVLQCERAHLQQVYFDLGKFLSIFSLFSGKETDENMTIYAISEFFPQCFTFSTRIEKNM